MLIDQKAVLNDYRFIAQIAIELFQLRLRVQQLTKLQLQNASNIACNTTLTS